tara:strand:+ start:715 stop:1632 length:918 start_codon:yes stop_codon:yes gene_type:complete
MLYTLNSMFKSRVYILVFFSLFASSQNIDFDNLEIWEKSIENNLIDEYKLLHDAWLLEKPLKGAKPIKDVWQKENEYLEIVKTWEAKYLEILNIWRDNPPSRISKMVKQKLDIKIGCDQELSKYEDACYNVEDEAILAFDGTRILITRDFMRENFENISIYFITEVSAYSNRGQSDISRKPTHFVILNNEDVIIGSIGKERFLKPIFKVAAVYPRRAQERGTMGYAIVELTITDTGSVENAVAIEGYCSNRDPNDPATEFRPCTMFNGASERAALKLKFKPLIFSGQAVPFNRALHRFTYVLDQS